MKKPLFLAAMALALVGCQTQPAEPDYSKMSKCEQVAYSLGSRYASAEEKSVAREVGRNYGCFGPAQPQTVIIDQTVRVAPPQ